MPVRGPVAVPVLLTTLSSRPSGVAATRTSIGPPAPCRSAFVSPSCRIRYAARESVPRTCARSPESSGSSTAPVCRNRSSSSGRSARVRDGAVSARWSRSTPRTWSRSSSAAREDSSMLRSAALAAAGSAPNISPATAAWIVVAVSVCPMESCNSWASRLRSASDCSRSAASASCSAGEGPSSRGASHRRAPVTTAHTAAARRRQPSATTQLCQPPSSRTVRPDRLRSASAPSQLPGRVSPSRTSTPLARDPAHPRATCRSSQSEVRRRSVPRAPAVRRAVVGSGSGTRSRWRANAISARLVTGTSPTAPVSAAQTRRTRAARTP